jgi:hypothetical protein
LHRRAYSMAPMTLKLLAYEDVVRPQLILVERPCDGSVGR